MTNLNLVGIQQEPKYRKERQISNAVETAANIGATCAAGVGVANVMDYGDVFGRPSIYPGTRAKKMSNAVMKFLAKLGKKIAPEGGKVEKYFINFAKKFGKDVNLVRTLRGKAGIALAVTAATVGLAALAKGVYNSIKIATDK